MTPRFTSFSHEDTKVTTRTKKVLYKSVFVSFVILRAFVITRALVMTNAADDQTQLAKQLKASYERRMEEIASRVDGVLGYQVLDLTSGERIGHLEQAVFPTASTIKLAIVYELFKRVEEGSVDLNQTIVLDRATAVGGSGVLNELGTPTLSVRDYATLMVMLSDNTATNVLIDRLGLDNITRRMAGLGLGNTKLRRKMMDVDAAKRGDENVSTPKEIVDLLAAMSRPAAGQSGPDMIALLEKSKVSRLRKGLPSGIRTADKPGELEGVRVDAGIVYAKNRPCTCSARWRHT